MIQQVMSPVLLTPVVYGGASVPLYRFRHPCTLSAHAISFWGGGGHGVWYPGSVRGGIGTYEVPPP